VTRRRIALVGVGLAVVLVATTLGAVVVLRGGSSGPSAGLGAPRFVERTSTAGVQMTYDGPAVFATGGGLAVLDCDADGRPDLYIAGGTNRAALYHNVSAVGGDLRFSRIADPTTDLTNVLGAYPLDVDGDGQPDLVVLRAGETEILRGLGGCRFAPMNEQLGFDAGTGDTTAFSATWEGSDALPTLALGRYLKLDANGGHTLDCDTSLLVRPDASGTRYGAPIPLEPGYCALSVLFSDWDGSGRRDLRITNDRNYYRDGSDQLWRIEPGQPPHLYTADDGWVSLQVAGMGLASYDLGGTGFPDVFITSQGDDKLQTLTAGPDQPTYRDIALKRGVTATTPGAGGDIRPSTSWHPQFEDVNDDGFIDLLVTKGNVDAQPDFATKDPSDLFLGQPDGTFVQGAEAAGIVEFDRGRGAALADLNMDGLLDLVEVHYGAPVRVWENMGTGSATTPTAMGHWLGVRLREPAPNTDAIGAWIELKVGDTTLRRELTVGGGHASGQLGWTDFGLGPATEAQVRVHWPDGTIGTWTTVQADRYLTIARNASTPEPWSAPPG
jgi:hypothetical protein